VDVPPELAQELLEASDQYMLDTLKHLCEQTITDQLAPDNVSAAFDLAENYNAPELSKQCVLYCLREQPEMVKGGSKSTPGSFAIIMQVGLWGRVGRWTRSCCRHCTEDAAGGMRSTFFP
jgi:hypothetical protein